MIEDEKDPHEAYAKWKAPDIKPERSEAETQKIVAERQKQGSTSRLSEYLTGMKPEDPRMIGRLFEDRNIVRGKYQLPSRNMPIAEFERALMGIAKNLGVKIKPKSECGKFFEENPFAGAVSFGDEKQIGLDIDRSQREEYEKSLGKLEHELIHAIQTHRSQSMPTELAEYEAYVAGINLEYLKAHPEDIKDMLFGFFIGGSVETNYRLMSEKRGEKVDPVWDNPEYFLKRDGVDPDNSNEH